MTGRDPHGSDHTEDQPPRRRWRRRLLIATAVAVSWTVKLAVFGGVGALLFSHLWGH